MKPHNLARSEYQVKPAQKAGHLRYQVAGYFEGLYLQLTVLLDQNDIPLHKAKTLGYFSAESINCSTTAFLPLLLSNKTPDFFFSWIHFSDSFAAKCGQ